MGVRNALSVQQAPYEPRCTVLANLVELTRQNMHVPYSRDAGVEMVNFRKAQKGITRCACTALGQEYYEFRERTRVQSEQKECTRATSLGNLGREGGIRTPMPTPGCQVGLCKPSRVRCLSRIVFAITCT